MSSEPEPKKKILKKRSSNDSVVSRLSRSTSSSSMKTRAKSKPRKAGDAASTPAKKKTTSAATTRSRAPSAATAPKKSVSGAPSVTREKSKSIGSRKDVTSASTPVKAKATPTKTSKATPAKTASKTPSKTPSKTATKSATKSSTAKTTESNNTKARGPLAAAARSRSSSSVTDSSRPSQTVGDPEYGPNNPRPKFNPMAKQRVKAAHKRQMSLLRSNWQKQELQVLTEEAAEWVASTLGRNYGDDLFPGFWERLATGVDLCQLAVICAPKDKPISVKCNEKASSGSFFARDNLTNFLTACRELGVPEIVMFEPAYVIERKHEKLVVNCLLELARIAARNGVKPPLIVQYELEIDQMLANDEDEEDEEEEDLAGLEEDEEVDEEDPWKKFRWLPYIPKEGNELDEALALVVNTNNLDIQIKRRKKTGEYRIGKPPRVFLRMVRHILLVRVGGGWEGVLSFIKRKIAGETGDRDEEEKTAHDRNLDALRNVDQLKGEGLILEAHEELDPKLASQWGAKLRVEDE